MSIWTWAAVLAVALSGAGALYVGLRWRRAPQAYRAMFGIAAGYFAAGALAGASILHLLSPIAPQQAPNTPALSQPRTSVDSPAAAVGDLLPLKYTGKVVSVTDGDTVNVALDPKAEVQSVRLEGIDAPETAQAFGAQSTQHLSELISGKQVSLACEYERSYGRLICKVLLPSGEDVDLDMVKAGFAWHYKQYQDEQDAADREAYGAAECAAMKGKIGLWSDLNAEQPQDFRHGTKSPLLLDANGCRRSSEPTSGPVRGNSRSHIFHWPGCPNYDDISSDNRVPFPSLQAALAAGYRPAHNCP